VNNKRIYEVSPPSVGIFNYDENKVFDTNRNESDRQAVQRPDYYTVVICAQSFVTRQLGSREELDRNNYSQNDYSGFAFLESFRVG
jgi:hypothetical protein